MATINDVVFEWTPSYTNLSGATWYTFPKAPSEWDLSDMQVVTESKRTVGKGALLHKDLLGEKAKYNLTWYYLTPAEKDKLRRIFRGHNFFGIRYKEKINFLDASNQIGTTGIGYVQRVMYGGDMTSKVMRVNPDNGLITAHLSVTWNLIER